MVSSGRDLYNFRVPYDCEKDFTKSDLISQTDPLTQYHAWFEDALECKDIQEPNAACLATCNSSAQPSCRMILVKQYGKDGFKFFTNYESRKALDLLDNPKASLLFYWPPLHRQVRIEGTVHKISKTESEVYFKSRPINSQISAIVSHQSKEIESRSELLKEYSKLELKSTTIEFALPDYWGGYTLQPNVYEFWQGHSNRLHDRLVFKREEPDGWAIVRIAP